MKGLIKNTQFGSYGNTKFSSPYTCMIYIVIIILTITLQLFLILLLQ